MPIIVGGDETQSSKRNTSKDGLVGFRNSVTEYGEPVYQKDESEPGEGSCSASESVRKQRPSVFQRMGTAAQEKTLMTMEETKVALVSETKSRMQAYGRSNSFLEKEWFTHEKGVNSRIILFFLEGMYYWVYVTYIVSIMLIGAVLMWWMDPEGDMEFLDALYAAAACVTQSGLATLDWHAQANSTHIVSYFLIIGGSGSLLTVVPALLRRRNFRMQLEYEQSQCADDDIFRKQSMTLRDNSKESLGAPRNGLDEPLLESKSSIQSWSVWNDGESETSEKSELDPDTERSLEFMGLGYVIQIVVGYWAGAHLLGFAIFYTYFTVYSELFEQYGVRTWWHALYLATSAFQNNGLLLTPDSAEPFAECPVVLITIGLLIAGGNTCLAIMSRLITWIVWRFTKQGVNKRALRFLLDHPRRCYTHMFPLGHTLWLSVVVVVLLVLQILCQWWQDWENSGMKDFSEWNKFWNAVFQAFTTRTAGINSVDIYRFSMGTTFLFCVMMYVSTSPTVVIMRLTSGHHTKASDLDITGRAEGLEDAIEGAEGEDTTVRSQARRYLTKDVTFLVVAVFLVCVFERDQFDESAQRCLRDYSKTDYDGNGIYMDFDFFKIIFEMASAYGTVGLSLGYRARAYSFSGAWSRWSQLLLILVMLLGRFRGLPDSVDPSVQPSMRMSERARTRTSMGSPLSSPRTSLGPNRTRLLSALPPTKEASGENLS